MIYSIICICFICLKCLLPKSVLSAELLIIIKQFLLLTIFFEFSLEKTLNPAAAIILFRSDLLHTCVPLDSQAGAKTAADF